MALNFGQNLFPPRGEILNTYDYRDLLRGQAHITFYAGSARTEEESEQIAYDSNDDEDQNAESALGAKLAQTFTTTDEIWVTSVECYGKRPAGGEANLHG